MYPSLDTNNTSLTQTTFKKSLPPSQAMTNAVLQLKQNMPSISSFKPHLNTHECYLSLIVNNKLSVPLKIVFLRNFPQERPLIFVTQWANHPIVNKSSCEVEYDSEFPWNPSIRLLDLLKRIQQRFSNPFPTSDSDLQKAVQQFDNYSRQVQSLRTKPPGTQPPAPPEINLENVLKTFEYQQNLMAQCQEKNVLYMIQAQEYNENLAKVRVMSEKFSKGKIMRDMQKNIENQIQINQSGSIDNLLQGYFQNRKKLHKMKILKELYQES